MALLSPAKKTSGVGGFIQGTSFVRECEAMQSRRESLAIIGGLFVQVTFSPDDEALPIFPREPWSFATDTAERLPSERAAPPWLPCWPIRTGSPTSEWASCVRAPTPARQNYAW
jgi:hypothetical protein